MTVNKVEDSMLILGMYDDEGDLQDDMLDLISDIISTVGTEYYVKGEELEFDHNKGMMPNRLLRLNLSIEARDYDS